MASRIILELRIEREDKVPPWKTQQEGSQEYVRSAVDVKYDTEDQEVKVNAELYPSEFEMVHHILQCVKTFRRRHTPGG